MTYKTFAVDLEETMFFRIMALIGLIFAAAPSVSAQIAEVKFGITEFAEDTLGIGWAVSAPRSLVTGERLPQPENSIAINAEIVFAEPDFLKWALSPQPYINGTLNLEGETSFGGAGLLWRQTLGEKFYGDISIGLVAHTGATDIPDDVGFIEAVRLSQTEIQFGSRILFRPQFALGYRVTDKWSGEIFFEHLSNGSIFSSEINEGVDNIGVKAARRF